MRKTNFLSFFLIASVIPHITKAHTINQHLEELYGQAYLPFFIIAKLLPFLGMGILCYHRDTSYRLRHNWWLLLGLGAGGLLSIFHESLMFFFIANNFGIIILGFLLLMLSRSNQSFVAFLFLCYGISLGYEYSLNISHAREFTWLFIGLLTIGYLVYLLLSRVHFFAIGVFGYLRITMGILFILAGLFVVLLA